MWQFLASNLPHATASLNAVATVLLVVGLVKIRAGKARQRSDGREAGSPPHTNVEVDAEFVYDVAVEDTASGVLVLGSGEVARFLARG
jgi:hypothetical protein